MSFIFSAKRSFSLLVGILLFSTSFAAEHKKEEKFNVGKLIMHHVSDVHEWHLWGGHHNATVIPLPIILVDGGLKVFSSDNFYKVTPLKRMMRNQIRTFIM
jgi:F-type H+-transporting ATPase subunit a